MIIAAVLLGGATLARAQPKDASSATAAFTEGQRLYAAGQYLAAADKFEAAYASDPDPVYLFNVGQAYRLGNACAKAATMYRKFLDAAPGAPNAAKVAQYIEQAEDCAKKQAAAERPPPPPVDPIVTPPPPPPRGDTTSDPGRTKRLIGLGVGAIGVVAVGVAGYYSYRSFDYASQREDLCNGCVWSTAKTDAAARLDADGAAAEDRARIAWVVGGVALIGGAALYLWGKSQPAEHATISVVPTTNGAMAVSAFAF